MERLKKNEYNMNEESKRQQKIIKMWQMKVIMMRLKRVSMIWMKNWDGEKNDSEDVIKLDTEEIKWNMKIIKKKFKKWIKNWNREK